MATERREKLSLAEQLRFLETPEARQALKSAEIGQRSRNLSRMRGRIWRSVPSEPWFIANFEHRQPFPPGGDLTLMRQCKKCQRYTPPNCIGSSGACDDCRYGAMSRFQLENLPGSTSSINLAKMKASIRRGQQPVGGFE